MYMNYDVKKTAQQAFCVLFQFRSLIYRVFVDEIFNMDILSLLNVKWSFYSKSSKENIKV